MRAFDAATAKMSEGFRRNRLRLEGQAFDRHGRRAGTRAQRHPRARPQRVVMISLAAGARVFVQTPAGFDLLRLVSADLQVADALLLVVRSGFRALAFRTKTFRIT